MKIPPIDLSDVLKILKSEGKTELTNAANGKIGAALGLAPVYKEWDEILIILSRELIPTLKKGGELSTFLPLAKKLSKSAANLSLMASQVLSFIPGPIGIICSIINAIVCFCSGNIPGGLLELIGCIPGVKMGVKGGSKIVEKVGVMILNILKKNPQFAKMLSTLQTIGCEFNVSKVKNIIKDIEVHSESVKGKLDTGRTYNLNFDHLKTQSVRPKQIGNPSNYMQYELERKGISNYGLGYGINPQTTIWPK